MQGRAFLILIAILTGLVALTSPPLVGDLLRPEPTPTATATPVPPTGTATPQPDPFANAPTATPLTGGGGRITLPPLPRWPSESLAPAFTPTVPNPFPRRNP